MNGYRMTLHILKNNVHRNVSPYHLKVTNSSNYKVAGNYPLTNDQSLTLRGNLEIQSSSQFSMLGVSAPVMIEGSIMNSGIFEFSMKFPDFERCDYNVGFY